MTLLDYLAIAALTVILILFMVSLFKANENALVEAGLYEVVDDEDDIAARNV